MKTLDWTLHVRARSAVEKYYQANSTKGNINIPKYDLFVTVMRKDFEAAGYELDNELDLFKLWGHLALSLEAGAHIMQRHLQDEEHIMGAAVVLGEYGSMVGLFLREMTKNVPSIPDIEETASE